MRLIKTDSKEVVEISSDPIPPYVILSHTWSRVDGDEVTFQDMTMSPEKAKKKSGYAKIEKCCAKALEDQFDYVWIDTCCIDKTDSAELSEAINSMYQWYKGARVCYAYLADVPNPGVVVNPREDRPLDEKGFLRESRWFTRGWTLQELIAPNIVEFYAADWSEIGTKSSLTHTLARITGIDSGILRGKDVSSCNIAERLSWAASRTTKKIEDTAYCLLGIFGVHMPLIYGEGKIAFLRLQDEIMKINEDYTPLAWRLMLPAITSSSRPEIVSELSLPEAMAAANIRTSDAIPTTGPLTDDPSAFRVHGIGKFKYSDLVLDRRHLDHSPAAMTSRGLRVSLHIRQCSAQIFLAYIKCTLRQRLLCILLERIGDSNNVFSRLLPSPSTYFLLPPETLASFHPQSLYMVQHERPATEAAMLQSEFGYKLRLIIDAPRLQYFMGWDPSHDNDFSWTDTPDLNIDELQIIRCMYDSKDPFVILLSKYLCEIIPFSDPRFLGSAAGPLYSNGSWNRQALDVARKNFWKANSKSGVKTDRAMKYFGNYTVSVACRRLGSQDVIRVKLSILDQITSTLA